MNLPHRPAKWIVLTVALAGLTGCTTGYGPALDAWRKAAPQPYVRQTLDWTARATEAPQSPLSPGPRLADLASSPSETVALDVVAAVTGWPAGRVSSRLAGMAAAPDAALADRLEWSNLIAGVAARNPAVRAAQGRWRATLSQFDQADYLETLVAQYRVFTRALEVEPGNRMNRAMTREFYPYGGTLALKGAMVRLDAWMARLEWEMTLRDALLDAGRSFFEYQYLARAVVTVGDNIELAADLLGVVESQYRSGSASQVDLLKLQTELERQRNLQEDLRAERRAVVAELNALLDRPMSAPLGAPENMDLSPISPDDGELDRLAMERRQETAIQRTRVELTATAIRMGEVMNRPDATQGYSTFERGMMPDASAGMPMASFGSQRKFQDRDAPAFAQSEAYLAEMRRKLAAERDALTQTEVQARALTRRWLEDLDIARRRLRLIDKLVVPQNQTAYQTALSAYKAGRSSFLDLLDAERALIEARLERDEARRNLNQTRLRQATVTGRLP